MREDNGIWNRWRKRLLTLSLLTVLVGSVFASSSRGLAAPSQSTAPPGPDRYAVTTVDYTKYFWWMIHWNETEVECAIEVDHEGMPTPGDVYVDCGEKMYDK